MHKNLETSIEIGIKFRRGEEKKKQKKLEMGFWSLLLVASMPVVQVLVISLLGAYLATGYCHILTPGARRDINKVVYAVFTPALMLASLAKTVTLHDAISWWFMPVNIGIIYLAGGVLGWVAVKILRPPDHLRGLVIASCSAANFGNLLLIIIPAVCEEDGNPFGSVKSVCTDRGLSYASFSMALGGFYIWTHTYSVMKRAGEMYSKIGSMESAVSKADPKYSARSDGGEPWNNQDDALPQLTNSAEQNEQNQMILPLLSSGNSTDKCKNFWERLTESSRHIIQELMAPPTISAIVGFIIGSIPWLKSLIIGDEAPLRVIQDSLKLLGDGTIPCVTLILGGNLTKGLRKSIVAPTVLAAIVCVRYVILPVIGIAVVKVAHHAGFLPPDLLYQYVLLIQFALPPAMSIGTISQLYDVGQEECSVIFLWTYSVAAIALTIWSTVFVWMLS